MQKMGTLKYRNSMELTEAEDIKKQWQEYAEELYKKCLNDPDNHDDVITHLEPDILECEVKWASGSIAMDKAGGGDGIPAELFQILKDDAFKVLYSICQQIWKTQRQYFANKGPSSQSYGFSSSESWTTKKAECQRIDVFELWCWRRLLRVPWTARRSNQSILKEINPKCS